MNNQQTFENIVINLDPDQRFFKQTKAECALVLIDKIEINHYAEQIILSGTHFAVDYEDKTIERIEDRTSIHLETNLIAEHNEGEE
ncbi:hypothetical protein PMSD_10000 [Paenibacillus macquariensis subsp. defensor]|nr:hypothetical protein PMSD_10000 [Paenibacillus macquariensis subsp. defensor]